MARPSTIKDGQKLNLYVPKKVKQTLFKMASNQRKSMSVVFSELVLAAESKESK